MSVLCLTLKLRTLRDKLHISCEVLQVSCLTSVVAYSTVGFHVWRRMLHVLDTAKKKEYSRILLPVSCWTSNLRTLHDKFYILRKVLQDSCVTSIVAYSTVGFHVWHTILHVLNKAKIKNILEYSHPFHVWHQSYELYVISYIFCVKYCKFYV